MQLGMEIGLGLGDFVLDGDPVPPPQKKGHIPNQFSARLLWANGWMDEDATWYGSRRGPGHIALDGDSAAPAKGAQQPLSFRPMSIVAMVTYLSYC